MTKRLHIPWVRVLFALLALPSPALSDINVGSDGSDGVLDPSVDSSVCTGGWDGSTCYVDLSLAANAAWDTPSLVAGRGVYDASMWAVVYKYSAVNIQSGVTLRFNPRHPAQAPVIWLVQGSADIDGTVSLDGNDHGDSQIVSGGPGGFRGGRAVVPSSPSSAGFGPGGGQVSGSNGHGGSYKTLGGAGPTYGNDSIVPLIGGSGGSGDPGTGGRGGGGGGGAILIAANTTITVDGSIAANGGASGATGNNSIGGSGSGGAIRLIADVVDGSGALGAYGPTAGVNGGAGRIRIEANSITLTNTFPGYTSAIPCTGEGCTPTLFPPETAPAIRIVDIDSAPGNYADPHSSFNFPEQDVTFADDQQVTVTIETENVPLDWKVRLRITPREGNRTEVEASHLMGTEASSTWTVEVAFPNAFSAVQARACDPSQGSEYCAP